MKLREKEEGEEEKGGRERRGLGWVFKKEEREVELG